MAVPYTFGSATSAIPLSQLDSNFATTITLGNTAIQLGNTVTTLNNMTLANVTVTTVSGASANAVVYTNSSGQVTANSSVIALNTSGNLGLGVTPSAWGTGKAFEVGYAGNAVWTLSSGDVRLMANAYYNGTNYIYSSTNYASYYRQDSGRHIWLNAASGTAGNTISFTQAMTLDASGNLAVGTTTGDPYSLGSGGKTIAMDCTTAGTGTLISMSSGGSARGYFYANNTEFRMSAYTAIPIIFKTSDTERARITSIGFWKASDTGSYVSNAGNYHEINNSVSDNNSFITRNTSASPYGPDISFPSATPNNTTNYFLSCGDSTNQKAVIYSSGTFGSRTSTYGGISDIKVKQDIVDASSQWGDIKALRFRKYRFKDDPTGPLQLGLISQEAELVSPGLVYETPDTTTDEEGNIVETGEITKSVKYSILYMKAVVALQEAMNRIEQLQADVAALKGTK